MKFLSNLGTVALLILASNVYAQQISPNPNPSGNTITINNSGVYNYDSFNNFGTIDINKEGKLDNYESLTNSNVIINDGWLTNRGTLTNDVGGTLQIFYLAQLKNQPSGNLFNDGTLQNYSTVVNDGMWHNSGILENYDTGTLTNNATLINKSGGTLTNNGTIDNSVGGFYNNGTFNGSGKIYGSYTDHGHTHPGNSAGGQTHSLIPVPDPPHCFILFFCQSGIDSAGGMTIDGDYFKSAGSKEIELGGLLDGGGDKSLTEFDWIDVTGNVELAGLLNVELIDGFELHRGNMFEFLRVGGTLTGQYDGLDEGALVGNFGGEDLFITYTAGDGNDVALYTNPVPEPTTLLLALLAMAAVPLRVRHG